MFNRILGEMTVVAVIGLLLFAFFDLGIQEMILLLIIAWLGCRFVEWVVGVCRGGRWFHWDKNSARHIVWCLLAIVAAIVTPSADAPSMLLLWLPAVALFEACFFVWRRWLGKPR
jgi:hypothetical protein